MIKTFGIRHHGPGSARSLVKALEEYMPDCILIEGPEDADKLLDDVVNPDLMPPVAILIYNPNKLRQASYFPFADFSPEWQSILFAGQQAIPVRLIDLPMSIQFNLEEKDHRQGQLDLNLPGKKPVEERVVRDPMAYMAELAGYTDSERWWEATFEATDHEKEVFDVSLELIKELRQAVDRAESRLTLLREAYMRKKIRKAIKEGYQKIAVICGAWHAPVLDDVAAYKVSSDNALLKGLKKSKVETTWIPWSYNRLAFQSGYLAGVISPAWYELLFRYREEVSVRWMIEVAQLLRAEQMDASSAHVMEAVRLADTLTTLRRKQVPGINELREAAVTIFCEGQEARMELIEEELVVGRKVGVVPPEIPAVPLQKDLENQIKAARLTKYWGVSGEEWLKATAKKERGEIDLRNETDLLKSHLLHRLNILDIPWGTQFEASERDLGNFKEIWQLRWKPDFAILIIEAGMWGNTVFDAAINFLRKKAIETERLSEVTGFVRDALRADLSPVINHLIQKLQELAALEKDVYYLMDSLPELVRIVQYGDTRKTNVRAVEKLVDELIPRISVGLPGACLNIDEEMARELFKKIVEVNHAIGLYDRKEHYGVWVHSLEKVANSPASEELIQGLCTRILFDKRIFPLALTTTRLRYALSSGNEASYIALWVEGFLYGSGFLLIYHPELWKLVDDWITEMSMPAFEEVLPLLRRTFSSFSATERRRMLELAKKGKTETNQEKEEVAYDEKRAEMMSPTLQLLLGLANR